MRFCPLLFAIYIRGIARLLTTTDTGLAVGVLKIAGLIFADDIVCFARTARQLKRILTLMRLECEKIKMEFSLDKSEVVSPSEDVWEVYGSDNRV